MYSNLSIGFCKVCRHIEEVEFKIRMGQSSLYFSNIFSSSKSFHRAHFFLHIPFICGCILMGGKLGATYKKMVKTNNFLKSFLSFFKNVLSLTFEIEVFITPNIS